MICRRTTLAEGPVATVEQCQCGRLHIHIGPFSMRFDARAVASIHATLGRALEGGGCLRAEPPGTRPNAAGGQA